LVKIDFRENFRGFNESDKQTKRLSPLDHH